MHGASMVTWRDYEGLIESGGGFGITTQADVDELNKALAAGQDVNPPGVVTAGDGFALRVESLERTLRNTTYEMEHVRFWRNIPKIAAYNTVEEDNLITSYGENPDAGFIDEGDLPSEDDSTYERQFAIVKYLGTTRRVTHVMSLVKPAHGNVIAQETINGTMHLLRIIERALFFGNSALSKLQFDGLEKLLLDNSPALNIIDLRGKPLSEDVLTDTALTVHDAPNYGTPTDLYLNPKTKSDLVKTFFPKERTQPGNLEGGMVGLDIRGYTSPAGDVRFEPDTFITDGGRPSSPIGDPAKRPATPTISTPPTTPVEPTSKFEADDAGDYFYQVQAVNRFGRSSAVDLVAGPTAVAVAAGDKASFGITPGSAVVVDWYEVFRTRTNGAAGSERLILRVPNGAGVGEQTVDDINDSLPGTTSAFQLQQNIESLSFKQLAPMVKIPLATIDTSIRWMQLLYGVLRLYTPGKNALIRNIGRAAGFVGQP